MKGFEPLLTRSSTLCLYRLGYTRNVVGDGGIEPLANHPTFQGNGFTARRRDHPPKKEKGQSRHGECPFKKNKKGTLREFKRRMP